MTRIIVDEYTDHKGSRYATTLRKMG